MKTFISIKNTLVLTLALITTLLHAQLDGVKYMLKYDAKNDYFDCYLIVSDGFAKTIDDRTQIAAKVSLVVPSGTEFSIAKSYLPLYDNANFTGIRPAKWEITTKIKKPKASPRFDYFSITPDLSETAYYNQMEVGDSVKLFSIILDTIVGCADGVRLFINGSDPDATAEDFLNQDLSNTFAAGTPNNVYISNAILTYPPLAGKDEFACKAQTLTLLSDPPGKGRWYIPSGNPFGAKLDSSGFNSFKVNFSPIANKGIYTLVYADSTAYDFKCITVTQPDAIITVDSFSCQGGYMTVTVTGVGSYAWTPLGGNSTTFRPTANTTYTVTVTDINGCSASTSIAIKGITDIIIPGKNLCVGDTHTLPDLTTGTWHPLLGTGEWQTTNPAIATILQPNTIQTVSSGKTNFIFRYDNCYVNSEDFTVNPRPVITITGDNNICAGETTTLMASGTGQWISETPSLISINNQGVALGLSQGVASVAFIHGTSGCKSESKLITVKTKPNVAITGPNGICIDRTTTLSPTSGGVWSSDNIIVAAVENDGTVTGLREGSAQFRFLADNGCFSNLTPPVTVHPTPVATITGNDRICAFGGMTTLSPSSGGSWTVSSNNLVATVSSTGLVTGLNPGSATFTFTSGFGCVSLPSPPVYVLQKPNLAISGPDKICVGQQSMVTSDMSGTWISNFPDIASVSPNGIITGLSAGDATFTFESVNGCQNAISPVVKVMPLPNIQTTDLDICIGSATTLSFNLNGTWAAFPNGIIQINDQTLLPLNIGQTKLVFTAANTGCKSDTIVATVHPIPDVLVSGLDTICVGTSTLVTPSLGGIWTSNNTSIASVTTNGVVTGIAEGSVTFNFIQTSTGCAATSPNIVVKGSLNLQVADIEICSGALPTTLPLPDGTWQASPEGIVTIQDSIITEVTPGIVQLVFLANNGCQSNPVQLTIHPTPALLLVGNDTICVGNTTSLTSSLAGTWAGSNFAIADITNDGLITGKTAGTVFFEFASDAGCATSSPFITVNAPISVDVEVANNQLETSIASPTYKWYDCSDNSLLAETTTPSFNPTYNGSFYLVIDDGICESTSDCVDFIIISTQNTIAENIQIFPNPATNNISIQSPYTILTVSLKNSTGQTVLTSKSHHLDVVALPSGMYVIDITTDIGRVQKPVAVIR